MGSPALMRVANSWLKMRKFLCAPAAALQRRAFFLEVQYQVAPVLELVPEFRGIPRHGLVDDRGAVFAYGFIGEKRHA